MDGISDKTLHSSTFRYLILYLAIMTTVTFLLVGYNQSSVCSTQRDNVDRTIKVYDSLEDSIESQVNLFKAIKSSQYPTKELNIQLAIVINLLEKELKEIKEQKPEKVKCFIF
jgi:hypothetical protein